MKFKESAAEVGGFAKVSVNVVKDDFRGDQFDDYNGDGKYDLLFNSTTGANKFVEANGAEHTIDLIGVSSVAQHHNYEYV